MGVGPVGRGRVRGTDEEKWESYRRWGAGGKLRGVGGGPNNEVDMGLTDKGLRVRSDGNRPTRETVSTGRIDRGRVFEDVWDVPCRVYNVEDPLALPVSVVYYATSFKITTKETLTNKFR